jgi:hypothetical protein
MSGAGPDLQTGLKLLDFVAIAGYLLVTFGIAAWFGARQHTSEDFFIRMFLPRCTARSAYVAVTLGVSTAVVWNWGRRIFHTRAAPMMLLAIAFPCLVTVFTAALCGLVLEAGTSHRGQDYTWRAIVLGKPKDRPDPGPPIAEGFARHEPSRPLTFGE